MTDLATASACPPAPREDHTTAVSLAARIPIPTELPPAYDGRPLGHLSHSSYTRFVTCPESWRRHYICGERSAPTGSMFLGSRVDDALTLYYRRLLEDRERLSLEQVTDAYRDIWHTQTAAEAKRLGIAWEEELDPDHAFRIGQHAIELSFAELIPRLGDPVAVQRKLEYTLAPGLRWTVQCYLDLETLRPDHEQRAPAVVDYKVKRTPLTQAKADGDFQPAVYLAGRWLAGDPAGEFCFAQIAKPGPRRKQVSASLVSTRRSVAQLRGALARIGQVAAQIVACYERFGPDRPWGFADPAGWKCSPRYCEAWARCPGGGGLDI